MMTAATSSAWARGASRWARPRATSRTSPFKILGKYKSVCFLDTDYATEFFGSLFRIIGDNLGWVKRLKGIESGWRVLMRKSSCVGDKDGDIGEDYVVPDR